MISGRYKLNYLHAVAVSAISSLNVEMIQNPCILITFYIQKFYFNTNEQSDSMLWKQKLQLYEK